MSRRKDRERYFQRKQQDSDYVGFRGVDTAPAKPPPALETVDCSVCGRKRNVAIDALPPDRSSYICLSCQKEQTSSQANVEG